jgi:hypothetical protein
VGGVGGSEEKRRGEGGKEKEMVNGKERRKQT